MSLISESRWRPASSDVVHVAELLLVQVADQPLLEELREADDRVQRRPQLVRHVREELRLVPADGLELAVQPAQLVVHAVEVRGERAELVAVRHLDVLGEVAGRDLREARLRSLDRPDQRPREDEAEQERQERRCLRRRR